MTAPAEVRTKLGSVAPFFIVRDIEPSIAFYVDKLGFTCSFKGPADDPYFAIVERDNAWFMLKAITPDVGAVPNHTRHEWAAWDAHCFVPDPDALAAEWNANGVRLHRPFETNGDNLRGFAVEDPDGYRIYFGRPAKPGDPPIPG